jgi:hypothetical protein
MNGFYEKLDALYQSGDLQAIEDYIIKYMRSLQADGKENSPEYASVLNELAGFYRGVSRYQESAEQFSKSLLILEQNGMKPSLHFATVLLNLPVSTGLWAAGARSIHVYRSEGDACLLRDDKRLRLRERSQQPLISLPGY